MIKVELEDGKYTVLHDEEHGGVTVLRYREPWRNETGDKLILAMVNKIVELQEEVDSLKNTYDGAIVTKSYGEAKPKKTFDL